MILFQFHLFLKLSNIFRNFFVRKEIDFMKPIKIVTLILSLFLVGSCTEKLDFNQIDNFVLKPVLSAPLTNFTLVPGQFFNILGTQETRVEDITNFEVFNEKLIRDNVVKIDFIAEIKNDFDRDVTIDVDFLDENNNLVYNFTPIQVSSKDLNYSYSEEIEIAANPSIKNTFKVKIVAELEDTGTQMNPNSLEEFEFKSAVTVYIESEI